jgi:hypothetical protein
MGQARRRKQSGEGLVVPPEYLDRLLIGADIDAFKALPQHGACSIPKG